MQPLGEVVSPQGETASQNASCRFLCAPLRDKPPLASGKAFEVPCFAAARLNHVSRPLSYRSQVQPSQLEHTPHRDPAETFLATIGVSNSCLSSSFPHGKKQPGQSDGWLGTAGLMPRSTQGSCLAAITAPEQRSGEEWSKSTALCRSLFCTRMLLSGHVIKYAQTFASGSLYTRRKTADLSMSLLKRFTYQQDDNITVNQLFMKMHI